MKADKWNYEATLIATVLLTSFFNVDKPVLTQIINQQVSTAPAAAHDRQGQRDSGGKVDTYRSRSCNGFSLLHSVINLRDTDNRIMKAVAEL